MSETQGLVWLLLMPITNEVNNVMQELAEVDCTTSEQHKDEWDSKIKRHERYQDNSRIYGKPRSI